MKIGVSSYSFDKYMKATGANYIDICDIAKKIGYDGIEFIDLNSNVSGKDIVSTAREIREHCAAIGLEISAYTVGANFLRNSEQELRDEIERVKGCVDIAAELGAKTMRHDACWGPRMQAGYTWRMAVEEMAPAIREIAEYAQSKGVRTCTENHGRFIQDPERVEALILAVNHPNYGWLVDMGNFICADADSIKAVAIALPYAFHVHAKDFLFKSGSEIDPGKGWFMSRGMNYLRGTILGHGVIPVAQCIKMFKAAGYDGYLSLEFEGLEDNLTALELGHAYLRRFA